MITLLLWEGRLETDFSFDLMENRQRPHVCSVDPKDVPAAEFPFNAMFMPLCVSSPLSVCHSDKTSEWIQLQKCVSTGQEGQAVLFTYSATDFKIQVC